MTIGLILGSILVQQTSLGAAYFLDPNILASFVMWIVYVSLLLMRYRAGLPAAVPRMSPALPSSS